MASPYVNYDAAATDYVRRRTPRPAAHVAWGVHVMPHLQGCGAVLDLAAGTGGFSMALLDWGAASTIAVEPSAAMQASASADERVHCVRGRAEGIPLANGSVDAIWISTAFHHFSEPLDAVRECRRVLTPGGRVLIRGFVPDHTELAWLRLFPGSDKAVARFPNLDATNAAFAAVGFRLLQSALVEEGVQSYGERADFSERMRHADSILTALSDDEVDAGIAALRARDDEVERFALSLLVYAAA